MAFDYTNIANTANTLIRDFGQDVILVRHDRTPEDPSKPYRGPAVVGNIKRYFFGDIETSWDGGSTSWDTGLTLWDKLTFPGVSARTKGVVSNYSHKDMDSSRASPGGGGVDGVNVMRGDIKVVIPPDPAITEDIETYDLAIISDSVWRLISAKRVSPGATPILFELQLRK